jgi:hypothetical protein
MTFVTRIAGTAALGAAMMIGSSLSAPPTQASYIVTLMQQGTNVVASGSGSIDLTDLSIDGTGFSGAEIIPALPTGSIITGPASSTAAAFYSGYTGPASFGSGSPTTASSGDGDLVGINAFGINPLGPGPDLVVPQGYVSGNPLSDTSTYDNATFASLGVTPSTYVWTWGAGAHADSFTLQVGAAPVPEPSSLLLLALPLGFIFLLVRPRRRAPATP